MRKDVYTVRFAVDSEGPAIRDLLVENGMNRDYAHALDWSKVAPFWIVAEHLGRIVGCAQMGYSLPVWWIEHCVTSLDLTDRQKAEIYKSCAEAAVAWGENQGASAVKGFVRFSKRPIKKALKRRGFEVLAQGNLMSKVLRKVNHVS